VEENIEETRRNRLASRGLARGNNRSNSSSLLRPGASIPQAGPRPLLPRNRSNIPAPYVPSAPKQTIQRAVIQRNGTYIRNGQIVRDATDYERSVARVVPFPGAGRALNSPPPAVPQPPVRPVPGMRWTQPPVPDGNLVYAYSGSGGPPPPPAGRPISSYTRPRFVRPIVTNPCDLLTPTQLNRIRYAMWFRNAGPAPPVHPVAQAEPPVVEIVDIRSLGASRLPKPPVPYGYLAKEWDKEGFLLALRQQGLDQLYASAAAISARCSREQIPCGDLDKYRKALKERIKELAGLIRRGVPEENLVRFPAAIRAMTQTRQVVDSFSNLVARVDEARSQLASAAEGAPAKAIIHPALASPCSRFVAWLKETQLEPGPVVLEAYPRSWQPVITEWHALIAIIGAALRRQSSHRLFLHRDFLGTRDSRLPTFLLGRVKAPGDGRNLVSRNSEVTLDATHGLLEHSHLPIESLTLSFTRNTAGAYGERSC
jgi:hypothetical protein